MTIVHVGFTGTQRGMTSAQAETLEWRLSELFHEGAAWFHHGDCIGADAQAHAIARRGLYRVHRHPPDKDRKRAFCDFDVDSYPRPYLVRNAHIVAEADLVIACPAEAEEQLRSGTWSTWRKARAAGKALLIRPDGSVSTGRSA